MTTDLIMRCCDKSYSPTWYSPRFIAEKRKLYPVLPAFWRKDPEVVNLRDFKRGASITVHYDPSDPGSSVVIPGVSRSIWAMLIAGVALTSGYAFLARRDLRARARRRATKA